MKRLATLALLLLFACSRDSEPPPVARQGLASAVLAGGCFWCMEPPFESMKGVVSVTSGYTGGRTPDPTYNEVSYGSTGHYEAVEILYDPKQVTYAQLLDVFWRNIDPIDGEGQFCDRGEQYRAAIFVANDDERRVAEASKARLAAARRLNIVTTILPAARFYAAEDYHQDYAKKNPVRYKFYRFNCGRDRRLEEVWGKR